MVSMQQGSCSGLKEKGSFVYAIYNVIGKLNEGIVMNIIMSHVLFMEGDVIFVKLVGMVLPLIGSFVGAILILFFYGSGFLKG